MELTPAQRAAIDALPAKRRAFVLEYARTGNGTDAATKAGYAAPAVEGCRLMKQPDVLAALEALREGVAALAQEAADAPIRSAIADAAEAQAFWSAVMRGEVTETKVDAEGFAVEQPAGLRERLKASELLGKSQGAFVERREVTGANGAAIELKVSASRDDMRRLARGRGDGATETDG